MIINTDYEEFKNSMKGVKDLVDQGIKHLPKYYIRSNSRMRVQFSKPLPEEEVPIIDLSGLNTTEHDTVVRSVAAAAENWGFFQVINHGVEPSTMNEMLNVVEEFFEMPIEDRISLYSTNLWERTRFGTSHNPSEEISLEWKDYLRHPCLPLEEAMQTWPTKPSSYRRIAAKYSNEVKQLADCLLSVLSEGLRLNTRCLDEAFGVNKMQEMFCNYYPPCPDPQLTIGIGEHSDAGGITILLQNNVEGLEVFHDREWFAIKPVPNAFVINLGDQLQILSNGKYKSAEHRAKVNSERVRISIPTFYQPSKQAEIAPMTELLDEEHPAVYRKVKFEEYVKGFFKIKFNGKTYLDTYKLYT